MNFATTIFSLGVRPFFSLYHHYTSHQNHGRKKKIAVQKKHNIIRRKKVKRNPRRNLDLQNGFPAAPSLLRDDSSAFTIRDPPCSQS